MRRRGVLITLEGNEGSGKSTQIKLLCRYLKKKKRSVFLTREPGGTQIGDAIRSILLDNKHCRMTAVCETLLYMASRAQLVSEVIGPRFRRGEMVLCDRWLDATVAYQGYGAGVNVDWIRSLGKAVTQGISPRLTIFLDLPLKVGLRRAKRHKKADRMEKKTYFFHQRVRAGYLALAKKEPKRFKRIEVKEKDTVQSVHEKIKKVVSHVL